MSKRETFCRSVLCPFYVTVYEQSVKCEGIIEGTEIKTIFIDRRECYDHLRNVCSSPAGYRSCPIYEAIKHKYQ